MFPFPGTALEGIFCIIPASLKRLLRTGSSGGTRSAAELTAACSASHKSQQCHRRLSQPQRCQHEPAQGKAAGFAQSETLQHPAGALASPQATRRDEGTPRGDSPGEDGLQVQENQAPSGGRMRWLPWRSSSRQQYRLTPRLWSQEQQESSLGCWQSRALPVDNTHNTGSP